MLHIQTLWKRTDSVATIEKVRVRANSKPSFNREIISKIQKRDKGYSRYRKSSLETDKDNFKTSKISLQMMLHRKHSLRKKCPYSELFWSAFSRIRTEYGEILRSECGKTRTRITPHTDTFTQ